MKYFVLSAMLWGLVSCGNSNPKATDTPSPAPQKETVAKENLEEVTLKIEGMTCAHGCAATLRKTSIIPTEYKRQPLISIARQP